MPESLPKQRVTTLLPAALGGLLVGCQAPSADSAAEQDSGCYIPQIPDACDTSHLAWGQLVGFPEAFHFGEVEVGESRTETFVVVNIGEGMVYVSGWGLSDPRVPFEMENSSDYIHPDDEVVFKVTFSPGREKEYGTLLTVSVDERDRSAWRIQLTGVGVEP